MSTEINTRGAIRSKVLGFPAGNDNECFSKLEILATGKALVNGSYGDNEYPLIDDIFPAKDIALGYVDANNKVHYIATLMNNPTFSKANLKNIVGDNTAVVILIGYDNFMNAVLYQSIISTKIGDIWIKIPCVNGSGSCSYNTPLTKIDDYSCYTECINSVFLIPTIRGLCKMLVDAKDASGVVIERSPTISFTLDL